ncbi:MAG: AIPR family protein [Alphaproteobacteria bacterium]
MKTLDWTTVINAAKSYQKKYDLESTSKAFSYCILDKLFPDQEDELEDLLTEGGNDCGVDAIKIEKAGENCHIHIFQFKFHESLRKADCNFKENQADRIVSFIDRLFDQDAELEKIANPYLWDKIQEIWTLYQSSKTEFTIYLCSNGKPLEKNKSTKTKNSLLKYNIELEEIGFEEILDLVIKPKPKITQHSFHAVEKQYLGRSDGDIKGLVATISARDLIEMIKDPSNPTKINPTIFDKNIRVYLGKANAVNETIIKTALSDKNTYFWYLNNGITAVCTNLYYRENIRSPQIDIENLQIVNGAQTSNAIFEAAKQSSDVLEDVLILIKVFETKNSLLPQEIALATNSQTRIFPRDLMSNSEIQVKLERAFENIGFYYERKKNQHEDKANDLRIDALKLGQAIVAFHLREPEKSKKDSDKIFGSMYEEVFTNNHDIEYLKNIFLMLRLTEKLKDDVNNLKKKGSTSNLDAFLSYGQFHILYIMSLLAEKNGLDINEEANQSRLLDDALEIMRSYLDYKKTTGFYVLFRSPKTKEELFERTLKKGQLALPLELVGT